MVRFIFMACVCQIKERKVSGAFHYLQCAIKNKLKAALEEGSGEWNGWGRDWAVTGEKIVFQQAWWNGKGKNGNVPGVCECVCVCATG